MPVLHFVKREWKNIFFLYIEDCKVHINKYSMPTKGFDTERN